MKAQPVLQEAAASAGDIHTSRGRAAHDLLIAAEQLLLSGEGDLFYISEKVAHATAHLASALQEEPLRHLR
jgi:hypothetical protein